MDSNEANNIILSLCIHLSDELRGTTNTHHTGRVRCGRRPAGVGESELLVERTFSTRNQ